MSDRTPTETTPISVTTTYPRRHVSYSRQYAAPGDPSEALEIALERLDPHAWTATDHTVPDCLDEICGPDSAPYVGSWLWLLIDETGPDEI